MVWSSFFGPQWLGGDVARWHFGVLFVGQLHQVEGLGPPQVAAGAVTVRVDSRDRVSTCRTAYGLARPARVPD